MKKRPGLIPKLATKSVYPGPNIKYNIFFDSFMPFRRVKLVSFEAIFCNQSFNEKVQLW